MAVSWRKRNNLGFGGPWVSAVSALVLKIVRSFLKLNSKQGEICYGGLLPLVLALCGLWNKFVMVIYFMYCETLCLVKHGMTVCTVHSSCNESFIQIVHHSRLKKSRIQETKHLSTDADSSTDTTVGWTKNNQKPNFFEKRKKSSNTQ